MQTLGKECGGVVLTTLRLRTLCFSVVKSIIETRHGQSKQWKGLVMNSKNLIVSKLQFYVV